MSTLVSKKKFTELLRTIIKKEIDEASTTATAGGEYDTPNAFSGKGKDRRNSVASGSGFEKVNETLPNRVWTDLRKQYSANELKRFFENESVNESGIMYRAGVKKYGKEGMTKIQQAAGKGLGHEEIGKIKDKYDKTKKETAEVTEDTKDIAKAKQISRQLEKIESKYRKAMYDLSDRLQADPKNHRLQDELVKSYTKHVTSFMRDMVKITKRVK
jgi:hypothetical protein